MSFKNFKDYLAERAKHPHGVVSDDKGFAARDYEGELSTKPKKVPSYEDCNPKTSKNQGLMTADGKDRGTPLGNLSTPGMTPKNAAKDGVKPADKTKKVGGKKKKMKVEQFLNKTKNMNDVQFTKHMLENVKQIPVPKIRDLYGREYVPEPAQTMKYVAHLMLTNENMMRRMIRELKRNDGFHLLMNEVLQHSETYSYLNEAAQGVFGKAAQLKMNLLMEGVSPPRATKGPASNNAPGAVGISGGPDAGGRGNRVNVGGGGGGGGGGGMAPGGVQGMGEEDEPHGMNLDNDMGKLGDNMGKLGDDHELDHDEDEDSDGLEIDSEDDNVEDDDEDDDDDDDDGDKDDDDDSNKEDDDHDDLDDVDLDDEDKDHPHDNDKLGM